MEETSLLGGQQPGEVTENGEVSTPLLASLLPSLCSAIRTELQAAHSYPSLSTQQSSSPAVTGPFSG